MASKFISVLFSQVPRPAQSSSPKTVESQKVETNLTVVTRRSSHSCGGGAVVSIGRIQLFARLESARVTIYC